MGLKRRTQNYFGDDLDVIVLLVGEALQARDSKVGGWINWRFPNKTNIKKGILPRKIALKAYVKLYHLLPEYEKRHS